MKSLSILFYIPTAWAFHLPAVRSHARIHRGHPHVKCRPFHRNKIYMSTEHIPNDEEIAKQKSETYQALSSFHETCMTTSPEEYNSMLFDKYEYDDDPNIAEYWECKDGAISFAVPMDPAAGLKKGIISKPYKSHVQIQMNINRSSRGILQRKGLRLVENIELKNTDDSTICMPFVRSVPLNANTDVDVADGSYSLDVSIPDGESTPLPLLPHSMMAGLNTDKVKFLVEHTIAVSDTERCRCFLLYGDADPDGTQDDGEFDNDYEKEAEENNEYVNRNYRLLGIVFADECKKMPTKSEVHQKNSDLTKVYSKDEADSSPSPLDLLRVDANLFNEMSDDDKMNALSNAINKHNQNVMAESRGDTKTDESDQPQMVKYSPTMFSISSGVYLGDTFIREPIIRIHKNQSRGFSKPKSRDNDTNNEDDGFATWSLGVQKTTLQFQWDYASNVAQKFTYGKCLGAINQLTCNALSSSVGTVVIDEGRATKRREERRVVWHLDGVYLAGLIGCSYFRAPRYMSFSQSKLSAAETKLTEFIVFYKVEKGGPSSASTPLDAEPKDNYCSMARRLYNLDGTLMQGSTGFFSITQPHLDRNEN